MSSCFITLNQDTSLIDFNGNVNNLYQLLCYTRNNILNYLYVEQGPAIMCGVCQKEGHLKMACPEENLPPLEPLPPMTPEYARVLTNCLWKIIGNELIIYYQRGTNIKFGRGSVENF